MSEHVGREKRIDQVFDFIRRCMDNPELLNGIKNGQTIVLNDDGRWAEEAEHDESRDGATADVDSGDV